uniref:NB-ARC domain-containing protein n=1 Tax=Streptomyces sp. TRM64462 TaxID=2741726 RepID=UPI0020C78FEC
PHTPRVPCHLPAPHERLAGRRGQLARMAAALTPKAPGAGQALVVVGGSPGTGKSELCLHGARQASAHYPDGQLFARLVDSEGRRASHAAILRSFLRGLGATEDHLRLDVTDLSLMFRTWTADRRVLVVLDDVSSTDDLTLLLPSGPGCGAVIGSRRRLFVASGTEYIELDRLPLDDGLHLLLSWLPDHRITMDPDGVRRLAELCRGLPGALYAVASRLQRRPHWTARQAITWAVTSATADEDPLGLWAGLERTLATVPVHVRDAAHTLLSPSGPARFTPETAAALLGTPEHRAERLLDELVEAYLLRASAAGADGRFSYEWEPSAQALRGHRDTPDRTGAVHQDTGVRSFAAA